MKNLYKNLLLLMLFLLTAPLYVEENKGFTAVVGAFTTAVENEAQELLQENLDDDLYLLIDSEEPIKKPLWRKYFDPVGIYLAVYYLKIKQFLKTEFFNFIDKNY